MQFHLSNRPFFVGDRYIIADIGLFTYTNVAEDGGFALTDFPVIRRWIKRVRTQVGFVGIG